MKPIIEATEQEAQEMAKHGITSETKSTYFFEGHKYDKLADALKYARQSAGQGATSDSA